jgi:hypothetical protein
MSFIAGPYIATWGGNYIGKTIEGFSQLETVHAQDIRTDDFGGLSGAQVDAVVLGKSTIVGIDYAEYAAIAHAVGDAVPGADALFAASGGSDASGYANRTVGRLATAQADELILTRLPTAGPATTAVPATRTFWKAVVLGDIPVMLQSGLRHGPVRFLCYPESAVTATYSPGGGSVVVPATFGLVYSDT